MVKAKGKINFNSTSGKEKETKPSPTQSANQRFLNQLICHRNVVHNIKEVFQLTNCTESQLKVVGHLISSAQDRYYEPRRDQYAFPIPKSVRDSIDSKQNGHRRHFKPLIDLNFIDYFRPFNPVDNKCYQYIVKAKIIRDFNELLIQKIQSNWINNYKDDFVYFHNGKIFKQKALLKSKITDKSRNRFPKLQIKAIQNCEGEQRLNLTAFYEEQIPRRNQLKNLLIKTHDFQNFINVKETLKELDKLDRDFKQIEQIKQNKKIGYEYQKLFLNNKWQNCLILKWHVRLDANSPYGRIYDEKSLYQNLSGESKELLRFCRDDSGKLQYNVDLNAAFPYIVKTLAKRYGFFISLLEGDIKQTRRQIAEKVGLSPKVVKKLLNMTTYGATWSKLNIAQKKLRTAFEPDHLGAVINEIWEAVDQNEERFAEVYSELYQFMKPYSDGVKKVIQEYAENDPKNYIRGRPSAQGDNGLKLINQVGRKYPLPNRKNKEIKDQIQTHILQGIEAAFIQGLVMFQEDYNYQVKYLEHDGATVVGNIPEEAIERARQISGFTYAKLEAKENKLQDRQWKQERLK